MKIHSTIKIDSVKETILPLLEKKYIIETLIMISIFIFFLIKSIIDKSIFGIVISIISIILEIILFFMLLKAKAKIGTKSFLITYPTMEYIIIVKLNKNEMAFANEYFPKEIKIKYKDIKKVKETKNYILIFLPDGKYFLINKKDLDINEIKKRIGKVK